MAVTREKENSSRKFNGNIPALSLNSDNMSTSTDSDDLADPTYEIRNIRSIINVTRENIDALNAKFAGFQHPPPLYLSEYQELTSKLHNLEGTLRELLQSESPDRSEECSLQDDSKKYDTLTRQPKVFLRAHLPNQQRTSVQVKEGVTLRDALSKALKLRNLTCEMCEVVRTGNNQVIPWDVDITMIDAEEVTVRTLDKLPIMSHISHQFTRKTFFTLAFCECCRRLLFNGFYCSQCNFKFHQRCADKVPSICHQMRVSDTYYAALLAQNPETQAGILHYPSHFGYHHMINRGDQSKTQHPRSLNQQDRSNSAPNVCINMVQRPMTLAEHQRKNNQCNNSPQSTKYLTSGKHNKEDKDKGGDQQHSQSTQASPTGTLRPRRARARSADESWKHALSPRESYDDWVIHADEILIGPRIGSGSFGTVYKAHWHGPVAVKTLNVKTPTPAQLQAFKNEVAVLRKTRHCNILLFMGCVSKPSLAIVTQWCEGSSLYQHLHVLETPLPMLYLIDVARQTAQGMDYLHAKNIIHSASDRAGHGLPALQEHLSQVCVSEHCLPRNLLEGSSLYQHLHVLETPLPMLLPHRRSASDRAGHGLPARQEHHSQVCVSEHCSPRNLLEGSSLYQHLHVLETPLPMLYLIDVARQTAQGMDYLHAKNIIHRGLVAVPAPARAGDAAAHALPHRRSASDRAGHGLPARQEHHTQVCVSEHCSPRNLLEGSSLYQHLHVLETPLPMLYLIDVARQTAQGMDYLHAKNIIHRGLVAVPAPARAGDAAAHALPHRRSASDRAGHGLPARQEHHSQVCVSEHCSPRNLLEGSSLYQHLHVLETPLPMLYLIDVARQTAQGMDYLHAKNIIHRGLVAVPAPACAGDAAAHALPHRRSASDRAGHGLPARQEHHSQVCVSEHCSPRNLLEGSSLYQHLHVLETPLPMLYLIDVARQTAQGIWTTCTPRTSYTGVCLRALLTTQLTRGLVAVPAPARAGDAAAHALPHRRSASDRAGHGLPARQEHHTQVCVSEHCSPRNLLEGSSLYQHLHVLETPLPMLYLIDVARRTAQGMDYLHAKNIIHRDLKSNNIFLRDDWSVKIGDFGLATAKVRWSESPLAGGVQWQQPTGSILWMAPEVIRMDEPAPYTFRSDVYAYGVVLYELMAGELPYAHLNNKDQILWMVGRGLLRPDARRLRQDAPQALKRLFEDCIKFDREQRPLFRQILASLESMLRAMPKITRSASEPSVNRQLHASDDYLSYSCASPKTPVNFQFNADTSFPAFYGIPVPNQRHP
ncbi:unnamed protein product [Parnassius apollo]|uniref:non-specific serine/threonine protein kinase n=1 Tax=Parnassius apollo TaxID=110799 RepID=A0A8S3XPD8_PARAO|nr:unnamed protein product [Parnassius apollo]